MIRRHALAPALARPLVAARAQGHAKPPARVGVLHPRLSASVEPFRLEPFQPDCGQAEPRPGFAGSAIHALSVSAQGDRGLAAVRGGLTGAVRSDGPVEILARAAGGSAERLRAHAGRPAGARLDAIAAAGPSGAGAARDATRTTSVVAVGSGTGPAAAGRVASPAKPGGDVTGVFFDAALANAARLPASMPLPDFARCDGPVAYGHVPRDLFRAGAVARRIADGARAGEFPVERPVRFVLVRSLARADEAVG